MGTAQQMDENRRRLGTKGPDQIPKTDPDSRILPNKEGGYGANFTPMATTESAGGLIVHADVMIGNVEHDQLGPLAEQANLYYCPAGKPLEHCKSENTKQRNGKMLRRETYTCQHCAGCALAAKCRKDPEAPGGRSVKEDQYEPARRRHRERMEKSDSKVAYARRTHAGEYPFAVIKQRFDIRRFLLRGIEGVRQEWLWGATGFNLLKLMSVWRMLRSDALTTPA